LALRGHDETESSENPGVFRELVNFVAEMNVSMKGHLKNATVFRGTSKTVQNKLLDAMLKVCQNDITQQINWVKWVKAPKKIEPMYSKVPKNNEINSIRNIREQVESLSPLEVFCLYFADEILGEIVKFSNKYAQDNNRHDFILTTTDLRKNFGILNLPGYHSLPQQRMCWSLDSDKGLDIVRSCMSRHWSYVFIIIFIIRMTNLPNYDQFLTWWTDDIYKF
jgi:hypothetical protein